MRFPHKETSTSKKPFMRQIKEKLKKITLTNVFVYKNPYRSQCPFQHNNFWTIYQKQSPTIHLSPSGNRFRCTTNCVRKKASVIQWRIWRYNGLIWIPKYVKRGQRKSMCDFIVRSFGIKYAVDGRRSWYMFNEYRRVDVIRVYPFLLENVGDNEYCCLL